MKMAILLPLVLILSTSFSLGLKTLKTINVGTLEEQAGAVSLDIPSLRYLGTIEAANQGPYKVSGFQDQQCDGSIALLPLFRNAEGSHILKRLIKAEENRFGVIFRGKIYPEFPQLDYTIDRIKTGVSKFIYSTESKATAKPAVLAFVEIGGCQIAEKVARIIV
ncbi:hypothetical protein ACMXYN_04610 [Neptuniibacter sp. PT8_73]|uniref:hypothetical protein n=1 Tax=Neptuniibacter sp. PT8_73 TaxID=3398206 RepID=UPI0039F491B0